MNRLKVITTLVVLYFLSALNLFSQLKVISSGDSNFWYVRENIEVERLKRSFEPDLVINPDKTYQTIKGFGGSFNELGYVALQIVDENIQNEVMEALFSEKGTNFGLCRMSIGANDFAKNWYSLNESYGDFDMSEFSIERDKTTIIPYIKLAQRVNPDLKIWGSPWSPPIWMKNNRHYGGRATNMDWGPLYGDNMDEIFRNNNFIMEEKYLDAYALYFSKYIGAYGEEGIEIDQVQPQNEVFANQLFPSCVWSAEDLSEFTEDYLIPLLDKDHPGVEVYYGTLNADSIEYVETLMEGSPDIGGIGVQWAGLDMIDEVRERFPDMNIMQTESECNNGMNNWFTASHTFDLLHQSFTNGANSYMYWNMILDDLGLSTWMWRQNSMISIDRFTKEVIYNPEYYIMKHFSHFIKTGAVRIDVQNQNPDLKPVAFQNEDGEIILVLWNTSETRESIKVAFSDYKSEIEVPANSISTVVIGI